MVKTRIEHKSRLVPNRHNNYGLDPFDYANSNGQEGVCVKLHNE